MKPWTLIVCCALAVVACRPSAPEGDGMGPTPATPGKPAPAPVTDSREPVPPRPAAAQAGEEIPVPERAVGVVVATRYAEGLERATADGRDLVILFHGSDWNLQGRDFVARVWGEVRFRQELGDGFVLLALDHRERESEAEVAERKTREKGLKFKAPSYPLLLVIDPAGFRIRALSGEAFPETRTEAVEALHELRRAREVRDYWLARAEAEKDATKAARLLYRAWETEVADKTALTKLLDARDPEGKTGWRNRMVFDGRKLTEQAANLAKAGKHDEAASLLVAESGKPGLTPAQLQWVALAQGNALRYQPEKRDEAYAALLKAHAMDPDSLMGKSAYRLAGKFVGPPSLAFGWTSAHCSDQETTWRIDAAKELTEAGTWELAFAYRRGRSALEIVSVALENGGEIVSTDAHPGKSGNRKTDHVYRVTLDAAPNAPVLVVQCKTDGRKNSEGELVLKKIDP